MEHDETAASALGQTEGFESLWTNASSMLTSYSDASFVSEDYGRELSGARTQAIEVDRVGDDPPERMAAWLGTVASSAVRALDLTLLMDLLRIEQDARHWRELMRPVTAQIEDLLLVGDFDAAAELVAAIVQEVGPEGNDGRKGAARWCGPSSRPSPRSRTRSSIASSPSVWRSATCWFGPSPKRCRAKSAG